MRTFGLLIAITFMASTSLFAQNPTNDSTDKYKLPKLHTIETATLGPSYSCRTADEFQRGYQDTGLYLSSHSKPNSPDLLFNGACRSEDYFEASLAGDDMSLIADLGTNVSLEEVSASRAFNLQKVHSAAAYSKFMKTAKVEPNHTYAVLLNNSDKRGLFIFTVVDYVPNKKVVLRYAVKSYRLTLTPNNQIVSAGFDWQKTNQ